MDLEVANAPRSPVRTTRIALLVLGMHRSGTSALTRCLNLLGAELPKTVFGAAPDNEKGHWEPQKLLDLNNEFLFTLGSRWDDWRPLPLSNQETLRQLQKKISEIVTEEYGDASIIAIKDPRICRFPTVYETALAGAGFEARFIIPFRNPLAVIQSLEKRDAMARSFASLLWLRHVVDAEAATRGQLRVFLSYERLMENWREAILGISHQLGVDWPKEVDTVAEQIDEFLSPALQHHTPTFAELEQQKDIPDLVKEAFSALKELENGKSAARETLSRLKADFDAEVLLVGDAAFDELAARENKFSARIREQDQRVIQQEANIHDLERELAAVKSANTNLSEQAATWEETRARLALQIQSLGDEITKYRSGPFGRLWSKLVRREA